ncbi:MAG: exodeoxyribonuclease VII large subunit [Azospirillaceae bacterium]|nr:exodeoxyribonuclease VII large subunit [Azospirillaceae bacterium]
MPVLLLKAIMTDTPLLHGDLPVDGPAKSATAVRPGSNLPEFSVSDLARALKRTVEDNYGYVRVRGEISQPKRHGSGHLYLRLKDETAVLEAVCWKGTVQRLAIRPEEGMEVVCTGRLTTYPGRSQYQLVIESMELAGEGALLKLLEERRRRLAAEGLFDASRKRRLPYLPTVIGVVTSPTGAVIRDILHRLADRFPRHVLLWPVAVQGEQAAAQIAAAIAGFNALDGRGPVPRPDLLIVARGGGSLEDLMAFNEEIVVRAAAASAIPLISAVGHETDTTLIDFAADLRAPTPTAAAEMAVPVRSELSAQLLDKERRLVAAMARGMAERRTRIDGLARGLGDPRVLLETCAQRLDDRSERLDLAMQGLFERRSRLVAEMAGRLRHPRETLTAARARLESETRALDAAQRRVLLQQDATLARVADRLTPLSLTRRLTEGAGRLTAAAAGLERGFSRVVDTAANRLTTLRALLDSYSYKSVLARGFVLVVGPGGQAITAAAQTHPGDVVRLTFAAGHADAQILGDPREGGGEDPGAEREPGRANKRVEGEGREARARTARKQSAHRDRDVQGDLF